MPSIGLGRWHFVLERMDGPERLEAADGESYIHQDRLSLLAVVRGLEALEQASQVRLVTTSRYVDRGLRFGLPNWRESNYQWESFGERKPVRNADLWRRVDVAMQYHKVNCRLLKSNGASAENEATNAQEFQEPVSAASPAMVAKTALEESTALVGRFTPSRVAYRVDGAHRSLASPHRLAAPHRIAAPHRCNLNTPARMPASQQSTRMQWWEMAAKWDNSTTVDCTAQQAHCGT